MLILRVSGGCGCHHCERIMFIQRGITAIVMFATWGLLLLSPLLLLWLIVKKNSLPAGYGCSCKNLPPLSCDSVAIGPVFPCLQCVSTWWCCCRCITISKVDCYKNMLVGIVVSTCCHCAAILVLILCHHALTWLATWCAVSIMVYCIRECPCCRLAVTIVVATAPQLCCHEACFVRPLMVVPCFDSAIAITMADGSFPLSWNHLGLVSAAGLAFVSPCAAVATAVATAAATAAAAQYNVICLSSLKNPMELHRLHAGRRLMQPSSLPNDAVAV